MPIVVAIAIDVITVWIAIKGANSNVRQKWYATTTFAIIWLFFSVPAVVLCCAIFAGAASGSVGIGFSMLLIILFMAPQGLLLTTCVSESAIRFLVFGASDGFKIQKSCDKAQALIKQQKFAEAEQAIIEAIGEEKEGFDPRNAPIRLIYGGLLKDLGRFREAAFEWEAAVRGELSDEQCAITAVRAADLVENKLDGRNRAKAILKSAIERHPKSKEMDALRNRLNSLTDNHSFTGDK